MEVYESHLGGIYFANDILPWEYLYCDECGDSDWHLGHADTWDEVVALITDDEGFCPYNLIELKAEWEREGE